ncbi:hypothetical protein [Streptomyces griseorubiginosus]|uniref:hypothetical protein n=1 Tax=Streptomyces griseorubiginosus TaxID=67304 RepID=UPI003401C46D
MLALTERPTTLPTMCLLHADFHVMDSTCWGVTLDWFFTHADLPEPEARALYQAEVERAMLDAYIRKHQGGTR